MTDKSFGDYTNRNVVKNPLLSTAVTGLSIEDLTHHAVLLPVSVSQEVITRPDEQLGSQSSSLGHLQSVQTNSPSGDATTNTIPLLLQPPSLSLTTSSQSQTQELEKKKEKSTTTLSKASVKSDDDFDVNEYFARLQGTRYVSAPLNSTIKEDKNANLDSTEENLEEINLNEPDKGTEQQSLTADIAQNFSQLPTVLPQVASAVFSSFSNMLSMKSREHTPDGKNAYQEVQFERPVDNCSSVPMMAEYGTREVAPPPKEPPVVGISNYRLPTKKKYAQIPGLTSDHAQTSFFNPMPQNDPSYFTPTQNVPEVPGNNLSNVNLSGSDNIDSCNVETKMNEEFKTVSNQETAYNMFGPDNQQRPEVAILQQRDVQQSQSDQISGCEQHYRSQFNERVHSVPSGTRQDTALEAPPRFSQSSTFVAPPPGLPPSMAPSMPGSVIPPPGLPPSIAPTSTPGSVIPPPPMFSNQTRRDSKTNIEKAVLPPSVARRIASNHPILKPKVVHPTFCVENLFTPPPVQDSQEATSSNVSGIQPPSAFASFNISASNTQSSVLSSTNVSLSSPSITSQAQIESSSVPMFVAGVQNVSLAPSTSSYTTAVTVAPLPMFKPADMLPPAPMSTPCGSSSNLPSYGPMNTTTFTPSNLPPTACSVTATNSETSIAPPPMFSSHSSAIGSVPSLQNISSVSSFTSSTEPKSVPTPAQTMDLSASVNFFEPSNVSQQGTSSQLPSFFNPNTMTEGPKNITQTPQNTSQTPEQKPPLVEPPKATGNLNYRMTKKRPQYYAGPIEGVGSISNNVKPVIEPMAASSFHGNLFIPKEDLSHNGQSIAQGSVPFDINRPTGIVPPADLGYQHLHSQPAYNTAFDFSRPSTESFEPPKQESKGFGLIGSLKSKLSSLDINKIQNSVTTFFDPAYNESRKESDLAQENVPYEQPQYPPAFGQYDQAQSSNFEIYMPSVVASQPCSQTTNQDPYKNQYYQPHDAYNYSQNQDQKTQDYFTNMAHQTYKTSETQTFAPSEFSNYSTHETQTLLLQQTQATMTAQSKLSQEAFISTGQPDQSLLTKTETSPNIREQLIPNFPQENIFKPQEVASLNATMEMITPIQTHVQDNLSKKVQSDYTSFTLPAQSSNAEDKHLVSPESQAQTETVGFIPSFSHELVSATSFFDMSQTGTEIEHNLSALIDDQTEKENLDQRDKSQNTLFKSVNPSDFFSTFDTKAELKSQLFGDFEIPSQNKANIQDIPKDQRDIPLDLPVEESTMSSAPLFGLSTMLANKTKELSDLEEDIKSLEQQGNPKEIDSIFNRDANVSFFENIEKDQSERTGEVVKDATDLNICETCREVIKPEETEEIETDDLTAQLIENIISPIQLLNSVEVPLPDDTPVDLREDFDSKQCAEISHITEDTIELLQVQSATELLDDEPNSNIRPYGWSTDGPKIPPTEILEEHDYSLPINTNTIGFFGDNSLFMNASDEIKAEFYSSDETPVVLPRQMSVPSAPPADEDSKSDETGLDVHSIEQDARKDFPVFEEFVAEPSETDDDKIEYREREKSSDDIPELDSFTSRVEKFKKMEGTGAVQHLDDDGKPVVDLTSTTSPTLPIASYFDTGNYAAETHYRNSLTSPPDIQNLNISSAQMRVPPGFEEEYQRRMTHVQMTDTDNIPDKSDIPYIPETATQTRLVNSPTFSTAQNIHSIATTITSYKISDSIHPVSSKLSENEFTPFGIKSSIQETPIPVTDLKEDISSISHSVIDASEKESKQPECTSMFEEDEQSSPSESKSLKLPPLASIFGKREVEKPATPLRMSPENPQIQLPDPANFFTNVEQSSSLKSDDESFSRLASYFATPAKTDQTKSFFELSQGQDHFRQIEKNNSNLEKVAKSSSSKSFFELSQSQNHYIDKDSNQNVQNIPHDRYLANLDLMKDLTSVQNIKPNIEQNVRTVNYFTVEYDKEIIVPSEHVIPKTVIKPEPAKSLPEVSLDDNEINNVVRKCRLCCDLKYVYIQRCYSVYYESVLNKPMKVRSYMNSETPKDGVMNKASNTDAPRTRIETGPTEGFTNEGAYDGTMAVTADRENRNSIEYSPVRHYWFYRKDIDGKSTWRGFSENDSKALENAYASPDLNENTTVPTDGGRYDVNILGRIRIAVYWNDKPCNVRRCSWFYKGPTEPRYVPYTEAVAEKLEDEYRRGMMSGEWHRRLVLPNNELVVMHGPAVMVHFVQNNAADAFTGPTLFSFGKRVYRNTPKINFPRDQTPLVDHLLLMVHGAGESRHIKEKTQSMMRPRVVHRGHDESEIEDVEPSKIDHLLLFCHGVGSACDMRFRSVVEVVDDFRSTSMQLVQAHYKSSYDTGVVGRVEVLPISWHDTLHSGETGVDQRLERITLNSIPRLRSFTNDTVLDVLFYTSPVYCQTIINTVCSELNRVYNLFRSRNPDFRGGISLGGHSLGSVILYDLLCHQIPKNVSQKVDKEYVKDLCAGMPLMPNITYPELDFAPVALYALGSPIAIFECIRGVEMLGQKFHLPTCPNFFNIFHPYDPIAYRIEPLINSDLKNVKPLLIPHHKGRKRMHLELKDTMARVGADIKQKLIESFKTTWSSMWKSTPPIDGQLERVVEEEMERESLHTENKDDTNSQQEEMEVSSELLGKLNNGRRVDYVLQEAPLEMINEYLFAMSSHVGYWESEDTMLLILHEIYNSLGVQPDSTVPQQNMTVQRTRVIPNDESGGVTSAIGKSSKKYSM